MTAKSIIAQMRANPAARLMRHIYAKTWWLHPCAGDAGTLPFNTCEQMVQRGEIEKVGREGNYEVFALKIAVESPDLIAIEVHDA